MLALLLASVLWPPTAWLRRRGAPAALAAVIVLLGSLGLLIGMFAVLAPSVAGQLGDIADQAIAGIGRIQAYITEPPLNLNDAQVNAAVQQITTRLQGSASALASSVLAGVSAVGSGLVTAALALVLAFFFIKDGPNFLPWLGGVVGERAGRHLDTVLSRSWVTLGSFIQGQAAVGLIDAVLIGIGLVVLGVPLALPLAVLTFFGGFVPIIGAFVVGALAVLVALVTKSLTTALIVLAIIFAVQQIEGNVLQPILQGRSLRLHPGLVLVAVAAGSALFGIAGAFLSVPVAAVAAVILRYLGEVIEGRPADQARGGDHRRVRCRHGRTKLRVGRRSPRAGLQPDPDPWCRPAAGGSDQVRQPAACPRTPPARSARSGPPHPGPRRRGRPDRVARVVAGDPPTP